VGRNAEQEFRFLDHIKMVTVAKAPDEEAGIYATLIGTLGGGLSFIGGLYTLLHGQFAPTTIYAFDITSPDSMMHLRGIRRRCQI